MADEPKKTAKKPPAHEVILARLVEIHNENRGMWHKRTRECERERCAIHLVVALEQQTCGELLVELDHMRLPESERPKILAVLRRLKPKFVGVHRSHIHLLKRLSGHSPAHVAGTRPKRRRG